MSRDKDDLYPVLVTPDEDGGFTVTCPDLPGCISDGETIEEAMENIKNAKESWLEAAREANLNIAEPGASVLPRKNTAVRRANLTLTIDCPVTTDVEDVACALDTLLENALSTEGVLDDYGKITVGGFLVESEFVVLKDVKDMVVFGSKEKTTKTQKSD